MSEPQNMEGTEKQYNKIGGWLILVVIGLVIFQLRFLLVLINNILPSFSSEIWSVLTTPGTEVYHPLWAPLLIFELVANIVFFVFSITVIVFFFQKRKFFPKMMIIFLLSNLVFVAIDYFVGISIPIIASQGYIKSMTELTRIGIGCLIWVPYFLFSKRVKGTFVR